ncbi:MAG: SprA-related family protein [Desulfobacterium sp.]|nr:SprA-related family protein [Desulfobacterium sp.]
MTPIVASQTPHMTGFTTVPTPDPALKNESAKATTDGGEREPKSNTAPLEKTTGESDQAQTVGLTEGELKLVQALKRTDTEVRAHEMAHISAGGQYVTSGAKLEYTRGPDGINYAVAGEVSIDTSAIPGNPRATMEKMRRIKAAALAPASPSAQDRKVAANAAATSASAAGELIMLRAAKGKDAAAAYAATAEKEKQPGTLLDIAA